MWPLVVALVLIVLVVAFVIADAAAKSYARAQIRSQLVSALGLPASADVTVDVGSGSILLQALGGRLDTLDVTVPKLAFGELVGSADIHATDVPLDISKPVGRSTSATQWGRRTCRCWRRTSAGCRWTPSPWRSMTSSRTPP